MSSSTTGTILLVDDEEGIRLTLAAQLASQGHRVLTASHGLEALHLIRTSHGAVDVALIDVVMPFMNGVECPWCSAAA